MTDNHYQIDAFQPADWGSSPVVSFDHWLPVVNHYVDGKWRECHVLNALPRKTRRGAITAGVREFRACNPNSHYETV